MGRKGKERRYFSFSPFPRFSPFPSPFSSSSPPLFASATHAAYFLSGCFVNVLKCHKHPSVMVLKGRKCFKEFIRSDLYCEVRSNQCLQSTIKVNEAGLGTQDALTRLLFPRILYKAASKQDQKHYRKTTLNSIGAAIVSLCKKPLQFAK